MTREYELKLASGYLVRWDGESGEAAAQRYVGAHPGVRVRAWREAHEPIGFYGRGTRILEPNGRGGWS